MARDGIVNGGDAARACFLGSGTGVVVTVVPRVRSGPPGFITAVGGGVDGFAVGEFSRV